MDDEVAGGGLHLLGPSHQHRLLIQLRHDHDAGEAVGGRPGRSADLLRQLDYHPSEPRT
jgi:hypothetical protein